MFFAIFFGHSLVGWLWDLSIWALASLVLVSGLSGQMRNKTFVIFYFHRLLFPNDTLSISQKE